MIFTKNIEYFSEDLFWDKKCDSFPQRNEAKFRLSTFIFSLVHFLKTIHPAPIITRYIMVHLCLINYKWHYLTRTLFYYYNFLFSYVLYLLIH